MQKAIDLTTGNDYEVVINLDSVTTGKTIDAVITPYDYPDTGAIATIGSGTGAAAEVDITFDISLDGISAGNYYIEFYVNYATDKELLYPASGERYTLEVFEVMA